MGKIVKNYDKTWEADEPCVVTGIEGPGLVTYHHLFTRKVYPEFQHEVWNKIPVSLGIHNEFHARGTNFMAVKYPQVMSWLKANGWFFCKTVNKWRREGF